MLQFIFGKPSSGKSSLIIDKIKERSLNGDSSLLIVPEQFTFQNEKMLLDAVGDSAFLNTTVLSFTRLCEEVMRNIGGMAGKVLTGADKVIILSRALKNVKDKLKIWGKFTSSMSFSKTILDTIGEFKINSYTPDDLLKQSQKCDNPTLALKLHDLSVVYGEYDLLLGERFIDPADTLTRLYFMLEGYNYFEGKTVFIDSFKGFTGQQLKIIDRILCGADNVYISFTYSPEDYKEYGIFTNIKKITQQIQRIAKKNAVDIKEPINLNKSFNSDDIVLLENVLQDKEITNPNINDIHIVEASDIYREAQFAARIIRRLVRVENLRYKDFVIVARDSKAYKNALAAAAKENGIPLFYDNKIPLSSFPFSKAISAAVSAVNFSTENILQFHKTGLGTLSVEEISRLENYTYLWNIEGEQWNKNWDMDPRGFTTEPDYNNEVPRRLEDINNLKIKAITPIINFKNNLNDHAKSIVRAILKLFEECEVGDKLYNLSEALNDQFDSLSFEILSTAYDELMGVLDSIVKCYENQRLSLSQFEETFNLSVSLNEVGVIPSLIDEVTFGDADRIRLNSPRVTIILGANQGIFPKTISNNGIFSVGERKLLNDNGFSVSDNALYSSIDEEFLVYTNLCSPSHKLYICYSNQTLTGESLEPSSFVKKIVEALAVETEKFDIASIDYPPETAENIFSEYCRYYAFDKNSALTFKEALKECENYKNTDFIDNLNSQNTKSISAQNAKKLYGENIYMSPSKLDVYSRCKFSYFCRYGLNIRELEPVEFNVLQKGTIVHFVLEKIITNHYDEIISSTKEYLCELTDRYIKSYLNSIIGFNGYENIRNDYLLRLISRSLKEVVEHISKELRVSDFKPVACELSIGFKDSDIRIEFPFDEGKISVIGSVDRVDECDGVFRIIDYKTGSKAFKLPDILFGLNMQMLIYLYSVIRGRNLPDSAAAGILYQPSARDINDKGLAMNGLLQKDLDLVLKMDKENSGEYIPKLKINKDGSFSKTNTSFIDKKSFTEIFDYIELIMKRTGKSLLSGDISVTPTDGRESPSCKYCSFSGICNIEDKPHSVVPALSNDDIFDLMKEELANGI